MKDKIECKWIKIKIKCRKNIKKLDNEVEDDWKQKIEAKSNNLPF